MMNLTKSPLLTDLYQLTMLQGYVEDEMFDKASFEFFVRDLPETRGFLLAAGLESMIDYLESLRFSEKELKYLGETGRFSEKVMDYLRDFRFRGDLYGMPEGTVCFANEPIFRVDASLPEAQLVESRLMNLFHYQTLIASKAARCTLAAEGRANLVDFGLRRAHGAEAGLYAARSSYMAGFSGTATVLAEMEFGIPISGTMAHSFVEAKDTEEEAFSRFAAANPGNVTLLIDTYDSIRGAEKAVKTAKELKAKGIGVNGIRLDSGDLAELSGKVRRILDKAGLHEVRIFVSGNIDEYKILELFEKNAPIDGIGVGTKMDTSNDAAYLDCAYKLMEYAGRARLKKSIGKETLPGIKQVYRIFEGNIMAGDVLVLDDEKSAGTPLLTQVMERGKRISAPRRLDEIRNYALKQMEGLPEHLRHLKTAPSYRVEVSQGIEELKKELERGLGLL